jgi:leader peptidase (prepilin peptidase)/N-methyltransferase
LSAAAEALIGANPAGAAVLGALLGAAVGSFLATVLVRWPRDGSALRGRSHCDHCGATLRWHELVPILSYLARRGRCRRCGGAIDRRHLWMELAASAIGAAAMLAHPGAAGIASALFGWWLLILAALDAEHQWLPDRLTLPLIPAGLLAAWTGIGPELEQRLIGAAAGYATLLLIGWAYRAARGRDGLGGGDPKLLAAIGAWLGWVQLPFVLLGAGLLGLAALLLVRMRGGKVAATDRLPLGTLMALAAWPIWLLMPL